MRIGRVHLRVNTSPERFGDRNVLCSISRMKSRVFKCLYARRYKREHHDQNAHLQHSDRITIRVVYIV